MNFVLCFKHLQVTTFSGESNSHIISHGTLNMYDFLNIIFLYRYTNMVVLMPNSKFCFDV